MRKFFLKLFIVSFVFCISCSVSKKYIQQGNYQKAFDVLLKKIIKKPDSKDLRMDLMLSYDKLQSQDLLSIQEYKESGNRDAWWHILLAYQRLDVRQKQFEAIPGKALKQIQYKSQDYNSQILISKQNAAEELFDLAKEELVIGKRRNFREAYHMFKKVDSLVPNFNNVKSLLVRAQDKGTVHVLIDIDNEDSLNLPKEILMDLDRLEIGQLDGPFVKFDTVLRSDDYYDFRLILCLDSLFVSKDITHKDRINDSKKIREGWETLKDLNGNVVLDAHGNPITVPRYVEVKADVDIISQRKSAIIAGQLKLFDNHTNQLLQNKEIESKANFLYQFARVNGDYRAISERIREIVDKQPAKFPEKDSLLLKAAQQMKIQIYERIKKEIELGIQGEENY
ncbi:MAG: hypothetical protein ACEPOW_07705 [Bacteroidales bacterium]